MTKQVSGMLQYLAKIGLKVRGYVIEQIADNGLTSQSEGQRSNPVHVDA